MRASGCVGLCSSSSSGLSARSLSSGRLAARPSAPASGAERRDDRRRGTVRPARRMCWGRSPRRTSGAQQVEARAASTPADHRFVVRYRDSLAGVTYEVVLPLRMATGPWLKRIVASRSAARKRPIPAPGPPPSGAEGHGDRPAGATKPADEMPVWPTSSGHVRLRSQLDHDSRDAAVSARASTSAL